MRGTLLQNELRTEPETFESDSKTHFRVDLSSNSHSNPIRKRIFAWTSCQIHIRIRFENEFSRGPCQQKRFVLPTRNFIFVRAFRQSDFRIKLERAILHGPFENISFPRSRKRFRVGLSLNWLSNPVALLGASGSWTSLKHIDAHQSRARDVTCFFVPGALSN